MTRSVFTHRDQAECSRFWREAADTNEHGQPSPIPGIPHSLVPAADVLSQYETQSGSFNPNIPGHSEAVPGSPSAEPKVDPMSFVGAFDTTLIPAMSPDELEYLRSITWPHFSSDPRDVELHDLVEQELAHRIHADFPPEPGAHQGWERIPSGIGWQHPTGGVIRPHDGHEEGLWQLWGPTVTFMGRGGGLAKMKKPVPDPQDLMDWWAWTEGQGPKPLRHAAIVLAQAHRLLAECKPSDPNCTSAMGLTLSVPPNGPKPSDASGSYTPFNPAEWQSAVSHDYPPNAYTIPSGSTAPSGRSGNPDVSPSNSPGGTKLLQPGGGVPLIRKPDGTYTSPDPAWAHLIERESGGSNIIQSPSTQDVNSGGNEAYGIFQITPQTWLSHGGQGSVYNSTPEQQAQVAADIFRSNPSGSDWGAGLSGREDPGALARGLDGR